MDGTTKDITVTINGTNDVAVISGTETAAVTEDDAATLTASGKLDITDVDTGEAVFSAETVSGTLRRPHHRRRRQLELRSGQHPGSYWATVTA